MSISVLYERYSYPIIDQTTEFTVNLVTKDLLRATDMCGTVSGKDADKFALCGLAKGKGEKVSCPYILESPVALECKVVDKKEFGSHAVFFGEIVNVIADENCVNERGRLRIPEGELIAYHNGAYVTTGEKIGTYGFTAAEREQK